MRRIAPEMTADMTTDQLDEMREFLYQLAEWYVLHLESTSLKNPDLPQEPERVAGLVAFLPQCRMRPSSLAAAL